MKKFKNKYYSILIKMSFPVLMNYIVSTLFEVLDKAIVGNYSVDDFAAVGIAGTVIYGVTGSLGAISIAYNIICAQYLGKGDKNKFNETFVTIMYLSLILGIVVILFSLIFGEVIFSKIFGLYGNVLKLSLEYFYIGSITILMNMIIFNFSVYFRNLNDTRISLYSTIAATSVNIIFDYSLVYGKFYLPQLGAKGAAIGSVIGLLIGILVYVIKFYKEKKQKFKIFLNRTITKRLIKLYIPLLGQDIMEGTIFTFIITAIISRIGVYEIAEYNLAESICSIMILPVYAFSTSAMTLSIQNSFGEYDKNPRKIINSAVVLCVNIVLIIGVFISIFSGTIFGLICADKIIIDGAAKVFILVIIMSLFNIFNLIYKSYLQGINEEVFVLKITCLISFISIAWIYILSINFGLSGVYIGLAINNLIFACIYNLKINDKRGEIAYDKNNL